MEILGQDHFVEKAVGTIIWNLLTKLLGSEQGTALVYFILYDEYLYITCHLSGLY